MVATMRGKDTFHMQGVGRKECTDIVGGEVEEALDAILLLSLQGNPAFAFEQGVGRPGSAPDEAGGIGAGGHGVEILVKLGNRDGLSLIDREQQVGGGAQDIGTRFAGKELELGITELVQVAFGGFPAATRADAGIEGGFDTTHVNKRLGFEGGGNGDDAPASIGIPEEQPGEEVGLELILTGLARQDDDEGQARWLRMEFLIAKAIWTW